MADRTQRYKGIVPEILSDRSLASLRLCELFFFRAKKLWSARYDFPPRRTDFAAWRLCELFFFSFFFVQRRLDLSAAADFSSRKDSDPQSRNSGNSLPICIGTGSYKGQVPVPYAAAHERDYLVLAKMPSRKEIVPNSLRLPYFASYFFSFFFSLRRRAGLSADLPIRRGGQAQRKTRLLKTFCIGKM